MASSFQKYYTAIPVLQRLNKYLIYLIVLAAFFTTSCGQIHTKLPEAVATIDSLTVELKSYENQLLTFDSLQITQLSAKVEMHLSSLSWKDNEAATSSLLSAKKYLEALPSMQKSLKEQVNQTKISMEKLLAQVQKNELTEEVIMSEIAMMQAQSTALRDQINYFYSRYHAQVLLIETLDKAQGNE